MKVTRLLVTLSIVTFCTCACQRERADTARAGATSLAPAPPPSTAERALAPTSTSGATRATAAPTGLVLGKHPDATPMLVAGKPTGFAKLPNELIVRTSVQSCPSQLPTRGCPSAPYPGQACRADADCTQGQNGYCHRRGLAPGCSCDYGCLNDSECGSGQVCVCSSPVGTCVNTQCANDSTCNSGVCATYFTGKNYVEFSCRDGVGPMDSSG